jgi:glycosyltransferase 2 family protein
VTSIRRWWRTVAGLAVAALFVMLLARRVDWLDVRRVLAGADWRPLALALVALGGDMAARITRWWWMVRAVEPGLPLASCVRPFLGSLALNNTVPLRAGDVLRVFGFRRALRAPTAHLVGTLVLERMLDLLMLLAILLIGVLGTSGVFPRPITRVIQQLVARLFARRSWLPAVTMAVTQLTGALALLRSASRALRLLGLTLLAWLLEGAVFACVMWSLHIQVPWPAPWLSLGAATLATLLPSSPGYVGTFDYFAALGVTAYGATAATSAAFALLTHLVLWLPVTAAGLLALLVGRSRAVASTGAQPLHADPA